MEKFWLLPRIRKQCNKKKKKNDLVKFVVSCGNEEEEEEENKNNKIYSFETIFRIKFTSKSFESENLRKP